MSAIHFAEPQWIHLLWVVLAFVALLAWLERRGGDALGQFVSAALRPRLLTGPTRSQRVARIAFLGAAGAFLTLALMRPQWGLEVIESERAGAEIMIALDVSRSMLAEDVAPNRLERAKAEIRDLLGLLDGDQVGLVAFAGRASVLSPLTPDFGFLRLALDDAGPRSVARGGTRLEEPIRKAIAGFGDAGDVSRSILLITDGEDHDSFPMEAAKDAAERGIRILAIGFGAEGGAEIPITDPETGARTLLRDADGVVVSSRLDGDLLREMALATSGAYIPAGTGQLDLESIYRRHIAPLTRGRLDGRTRTVRNDAFQWAVLLGLLSLLGAAMSTARGRERPAGHDAGTFGVLALTTMMAMTITLAGMPAPAAAQTGSGTTAPAAGTPAAHGTASPGSADPSAGEDQAGTTTSGEPAPAVEIPEDPRVAYNQGLEALNANDTETAARLLEAAREQAGTDAEARYSATYNLGWVEVRAADALVESAPADALERLYRAASWFREAVDLRPGAEDARYNLELVMRRALELADSLASRDEGDLLARLETLIESQRGFLGLLREGVAAQQQAADANAAPELRRQFRGLAARGLTVLGDAEALGELAAREGEAIAAKPESERTPDEALRGAQLEAVIGHLHRARERIAQARTRLRRLQGERAYRRAAAALGAFRRARDQLLDPVTRLDTLLADGMEVAQLTAVKAALARGLQGLDTAAAPAAAPDWLTPKYLAESQTRLSTRTGELHQGLATGLAEPDAGAEQAPEQARLIARLREATPLIEAARGGFEAAAGALSSVRLDEALEGQRVALEALASARELLLELRQLIELVYGEEQRVAALLDEEPAEAGAPAAPAPPATIGATLHERNVERAIRLGTMLSEAMIEAQESAASEDTGAAPAASGQGGQFERGYELLREALDSMHAASQSFGEIGEGDADRPDPSRLASTRSSVDQAVSHLEALRRLFFSVLEHLRETAERQRELADDTETTAALADPADPGAIAGKAGPLGHRQQGLAATAHAIGEALRTQGSAPAPDDAPEGAGPDPELLLQAAELVTTAGGTMKEAAAGLGAEPPAMEDARADQDSALEALAQAIALLQPEQEGDQRQEQQQQQSDDGEGEGEQQPQPDPGESNPDLAQLLQGVRDREAKRREERANAGASGYEPVEKDW